MPQTDEVTRQLRDEVTRLRARLVELEARWLNEPHEIHSATPGESSIHESEARFRAFMDHCPAASFLKDADGRFLYVNRVWLKQFRVTPTEWYGKSDADFWPPATVETFRASDERCLKGNEPVELEEEGIDSEGQRRVWHVMKFPMVLAGQRVVGGIAWDVTARVMAEEQLTSSEARYRVLFEQMPTAMLIVDPASAEFLGANEAAVQQYGYPAAEWQGLPIAALDPGLSEDPIADRIRRVLEPGLRQHRIRTGQVIQVEVVKHVFHGASHRTEIIQAMNVTARWDAERAAQSARESLVERIQEEKEIVARELERSKQELLSQARLAALGKIAGTMAHDLRNPLGAIRNACFLLRRKAPADQPAWKEYLGLIDREVGTCDRLLSNLLELARSRPLQIDDVDLGSLIRQVYDLHQTQGSMQLTFDAGAEPLHLRADRTQLTQVFNQLMRNSSDATEGRGTVTVTTTVTPDAIILDWRDSGPGISPSILAQAFEPLVTTKARGTGLGLWICQQVMDRHGGSIQMESGPGAPLRLILPKVASRQGGPSSDVDGL